MNEPQSLTHRQELVKVSGSSVCMLTNIVSALDGVLPDLQFVVVGIIAKIEFEGHHMNIRHFEVWSVRSITYPF
jgi:hypothetical protein